MCRTHSTDHVSIGKRLLWMLVNIVSGDASASSLYLSNRARLLDAAADFREDGYPTISNKKAGSLHPKAQGACVQIVHMLGIRTLPSCAVQWCYSAGESVASSDTDSPSRS
jgi:hypothetical protein